MGHPLAPFSSPNKPFAMANAKRVPFGCRCVNACAHVLELATASECHPFKFWSPPAKHHDDDRCRGLGHKCGTAERALSKLVNAFECFIKQRDKINVIKNIIFVWISWHFILSGGGFAESLFALCKWFIIYGAPFLDRWDAFRCCTRMRWATMVGVVSNRQQKQVIDNHFRRDVCHHFSLIKIFHPVIRSAWLVMQ